MQPVETLDNDEFNQPSNRSVFGASSLKPSGLLLYLLQSISLLNHEKRSQWSQNNSNKHFQDDYMMFFTNLLQCTYNCSAGTYNCPALYLQMFCSVLTIVLQCTYNCSAVYLQMLERRDYV